MFFETEEEVFPPRSSISSCACVRVKPSKVPVKTKVFPSKFAFFMIFLLFSSIFTPLSSNLSISFKLSSSLKKSTILPAITFPMSLTEESSSKLRLLIFSRLPKLDAKSFAVLLPTSPMPSANKNLASSTSFDFAIDFITLSAFLSLNRSRLNKSSFFIE